MTPTVRQYRALLTATLALGAVCVLWAVASTL